jgi:hypothetical protein
VTVPTAVERARHLRTLKKMADYRRGEIGRRLAFGGETFLQKQEVAALEFAFEILEYAEAKAAAQRRG